MTADHYAEKHNVTAIKPDREMNELRCNNNEYTLIKHGTEYLPQIIDNTFDVVICHNVLEYIRNTKPVLKQLVRVLKPSGKLSVVKHNVLCKAMSYAVFKDDPGAAKRLLSNGNEEIVYSA